LAFEPQSAAPDCGFFFRKFSDGSSPSRQDRLINAEAIMAGLNLSPRDMQQLLNNILKDARSVSLTTLAGDRLTVGAPVELGTDCIDFGSRDGGKTIVPLHAIQRIQVS
jgi:hypothetical protein